MKLLQTEAIVILAYILCHGLTALLVTPLQSQISPHVTAFASLLYLPHGVRVLSAWLLGWRAVLPLCVGAFLSELIFTPAGMSGAASPVILASIAVGAVSAPVAFELLKLMGRNLYAGTGMRIHWSALLVAGILASILNSIGQAEVFSGLILPGSSMAVLAVYAIGDLAGLVAATLVLMMVFRWMRLAARPGATR
ncbi:hypothetical protein [Mangrovicoccus ximenensis]|uniref:hypothetical protein n=1 Tax=Mangrovicoccus ximenensis TaxID=1911570 RepID=UPI000D3D89AE|nr:hypothetical protein [Mangrovicoccus ximenensis]